MRIERPIGAGINGADFSAEMDYLESQGVESVTIEINSPGGSIKEGFSIFNAIKNSGMKTTTKVIGIAASMAGIISQAGDKRVIVDYGIFHAHGPQVPAGKKVDGDLLSIMLESLKTLISSKADIAPEKVAEMLSKETVMTAVQAKEMGFFDEIEVTKSLKPVLEPTNSVDALFELANEFINKNNKMEKLNAFLGLENGTEEQILSAVESFKTEADKVESLTNELTEAKQTTEDQAAKITELNNSIEEMKTAMAAELIENAIKASKIKEDAKESWLTQAKNNLEETKTLLSGISEIAPVAKAVKVVENIKPEGQDDERKDWDFQQWGENDPKGLEKMSNEDPEKYDALLNAYVEK